LKGRIEIASVGQQHEEQFKFMVMSVSDLSNMADTCYLSVHSLFVFLSLIQKCIYCYIQNYNFTCCYVWVWNLVF